MAASLAALGVVMLWLGHYFRGSANSKAGTGFFWLVSAFLLLIGAPSVAMNRLTFSETYVEQRTGYWFAPATYRFDFDSISSIRLKFGRSPDADRFTLGRNSHGPDWLVIVTFKDKTTTTFHGFKPWHHEQAAIAAFLAKRGIEFKGRSRPGVASPNGIAPQHGGLAIFDPHSPPLFLALGGMAIAWFVLLKLVSVRLKASHPRTYEAIATPDLSRRNDYPASLGVLGFVMGRRHKRLGDKYLSTICDVGFALFFAYLIAFSGLFFAFMLSPRAG